MNDVSNVSQSFKSILLLLFMNDLPNVSQFQINSVAGCVAIACNDLTMFLNVSNQFCLLVAIVYECLPHVSQSFASILLLLLMNDLPDASLNLKSILFTDSASIAYK